jgi:hypothetical protein
MAPTDAKASCLYPNGQRAIREAMDKGFDNAIMLGLDDATLVGVPDAFVLGSIDDLLLPDSITRQILLIPRQSRHPTPSRQAYFNLSHLVVTRHRASLLTNAHAPNFSPTRVTATNVPPTLNIAITVPLPLIPNIISPPLQYLEAPIRVSHTLIVATNVTPTPVTAADVVPTLVTDSLPPRLALARPVHHQPSHRHAPRSNQLRQSPLMSTLPSASP